MNSHLMFQAFNPAAQHLNPHLPSALNTSAAPPQHPLVPQIMHSSNPQPLHTQNPQLFNSSNPQLLQMPHSYPASASQAASIPAPDAAPGPKKRGRKPKPVDEMQAKRKADDRVKKQRKRDKTAGQMQALQAMLPTSTSNKTLNDVLEAVLELVRGKISTGQTHPAGESLAPSESGVPHHVIRQGMNLYGAEGFLILDTSMVVHDVNAKMQQFLCGPNPYRTKQLRGQPLSALVSEEDAVTIRHILNYLACPRHTGKPFCATLGSLKGSKGTVEDMCAEFHRVDVEGESRLLYFIRVCEAVDLQEHLASRIMFTFGTENSISEMQYHCTSNDPFFVSDERDEDGNFFLLAPFDRRLVSTLGLDFDLPPVRLIRNIMTDTGASDTEDPRTYFNNALGSKKVYFDEVLNLKRTGKDEFQIEPSLNGYKLGQMVVKSGNSKMQCLKGVTGHSPHIGPDFKMRVLPTGQLWMDGRVTIPGAGVSMKINMLSEGNPRTGVMKFKRYMRCNHWCMQSTRVYQKVWTPLYLEPKPQFTGSLQKLDLSAAFDPETVSFFEPDSMSSNVSSTEEESADSMRSSSSSPPPLNPQTSEAWSISAPFPQEDAFFTVLLGESEAAMHPVEVLSRFNSDDLNFDFRI